MNGQWPYWLTLGGEAGRTAANSDTVAWLMFTANFGVFLFSIGMGIGFFIREAIRAKSPLGYRLKRDIGILFVIGGLAGFGIPCLMMWFPIWTVTLLARWITLIVLVKISWGIWRHGAHIQFFQTIEEVDHIKEAAASLAEVARGVAKDERRLSMRNQLLRDANKLAAAIGEGS